MKRVVVATIMVLLALYSFSCAQDSGFGLGIIIGEPSGISAKLWTDSTRAFDGAVAWSFENDNLHLHVDYLWHIEYIKVKKGRLPFYVGVGGKLRVVEDETRVSVRIPLGMNYLFEDVPLDLFLEIVPAMRLIKDTELEIDAGIGIRYFF